MPPTVKILREYASGARTFALYAYSIAPRRPVAYPPIPAIPASAKLTDLSPAKTAICR